ncbi:MAG: threonine-phosphate decarboxylase CobD [Pseudanabaenaceae cyanobacterium SKYGB_i_bin29]|nr:threonine-phosphate decarboxylase CobD [Pseudanabaenaceae cyanobacterium SKYG29]MDW8420398.1 threonine-phosphate decarboxylase CobD [Pseudanabaenaceae cyanobacterium SKYGB_i_bin29]
MEQAFKHGGNRAWWAQIAGVSPRDLVDFSASINPLGPPASALVALQAALPEISHYPDPHYPELRQALADFYGVDPARLLPGNGAAELLTWIARDLAELATTVILRPAFADYDRALQSCHARVKNISIWETEFTAQILGINQPDRQGLLLNNPHNPTGQLLDKSWILECLDRFALVVIDEAFMDFLPPELSCVDLVERYSNLVILRSLTKFFSIAGLRLGCVIAHPDRIRKWQGWRDPWAVNNLAAAVGIAVVKDREFQEQTRAWLIPSRRDLEERLYQFSELSPLPSVANFLLVKTAIPSTRLQSHLAKEHKILIRDCATFLELGQNYIRLAVLTAREHKLLQNALQSSVHLLRA